VRRRLVHKPGPRGLHPTLERDACTPNTHLDAPEWRPPSTPQGQRRRTARRRPGWGGSRCSGRGCPRARPRSRDGWAPPRCCAAARTWTSQSRGCRSRTASRAPWRGAPEVTRVEGGRRADDRVALHPSPRPTCTGCRPSRTFPMPSTVTTCAPSTQYSGHRHALTAMCVARSAPRSLLETITVHAPQPPSPQPSLVPV